MGKSVNKVNISIKVTKAKTHQIRFLNELKHLDENIMAHNEKKKKVKK